MIFDTNLFIWTWFYGPKHGFVNNRQFVFSFNIPYAYKLVKFAY